MFQKYKNGELSSKQSFMLIINIMIGTGVLNIARVVAEVSKQDAWISVLINGIFICFTMVVIVFIISKFPKHTFQQYTSYLLGKPIGYLITLGYVIYAILVTSVVISYLSSMVYTWLLPNTPKYIMNLIIVITIVYMTKGGITTLARFNEAISFFLIPFALLIFVGLPEASFINLRPIGGSGIVTILKGTMPAFYAFSGYEVILVYYRYISNKKAPIMKYSVMAIIIVTIYYVVTVISQIALYGSDEILRVLYPSINYLTAVDFPLIERTEIFFTIFWIFTVLATIGIQYLTVGILLQDIFKTKQTNIFIYALSPIIYLIPFFIKNAAMLVKIGGILGNLNIFFGVLLPLILLITYLIKGRDVNYEKNN